VNDRSDRRAEEAVVDPGESTLRAPSAAEDVLQRVLDQVAVTTVGYEEVVRLLYIALLTEGHVLLEGTPGIAKTQLVRRFAESLALSFKRIQFTPDMLPSDIIGNVILNPLTRTFDYHRGPVFANVVLADEINRAPPKVQAAMLESMQERQVTIDGVSHPLPRPFIVIATQNPIDQEGTYPLPEAELDRILFRVLLEYPTEPNEREIIRRTVSGPAPERELPVADARSIANHRQRAVDVFLSDEIVDYVGRLVRATRADARIVVGASPRAGVQLARAAKARAMLTGRPYVAPEDVEEMAFWVLNHRVSLDPDLVSDEASEGSQGLPLLRRVLAELFDTVRAPR
jgi:MoxR-like ATPase